jgi:hypothetical protein
MARLIGTVKDRGCMWNAVVVLVDYIKWLRMCSPTPRLAMNVRQFADLMCKSKSSVPPFQIDDVPPFNAPVQKTENYSLPSHQHEYGH